MQNKDAVDLLFKKIIKINMLIPGIAVGHSMGKGYYFVLPNNEFSRDRNLALTKIYITGKKYCELGFLLNKYTLWVKRAVEFEETFNRYMTELLEEELNK